ncbi:ABC phosphonate transporter ATP-binding protein [Psychromonas ingrahamii 37]|uniref:ABC phosphonate transporter ATP-binding protein n=1 Tax=Psychromonas ingrahamii (strain DSM 17664 / CCUG 51855 / 37) TaxID=357804 RepID=A1T0V6_PSYIN|nr:phosphonate ABC transporter ATP-binding protein [Psychromonas ingrahamii]ABM05371.1 ABC phosphonate transporter ATP-binding protein [Psychromonas ingrahamii 37]
MLIFDNVSRIYSDGTQAVKEVSIRLEKSGFCVLLGPSGAGKSTLMNMVNGLVEPSSGKIYLDGQPLEKKNLKMIQRSVSMIHQQLYLVPRLSVLSNVLTGVLPQAGFWLSMIKYFPVKDQQRACELLSEVGLEEKHLVRRASELSGGQQQRVAIARAFMASPKVVLADEPVASLDPAMSRSVLNSLKTAAQINGAAVLCTLHQMDYALEFADRIIALRDGEVFFDGPPSEMTADVQKRLYAIERENLDKQHSQSSETIKEPAQPRIVKMKEASA